MSLKSFFKIAAVLSLTSFSILEAQAQGFPGGCKVSGFGFNGAHLVLNRDGNQTYFLVQNKITYPIELQRIETHNLYISPPLTAHIDGGNWAAFASDVDHMVFQCLNVTDANQPVKVNCEQVLAICQYPNVRFAASNMGNYWVSVNKNQQEIINDSTKATGIYLRW